MNEYAVHGAVKICLRRRANFALARLKAIPSRLGEPNSVGSAGAAVEVVAFRRKEPVAGGLRDSLVMCSTDFSEVNELGEKWSG